MMKTLFVFFILYVVHDQRGEYTEGENAYHIGKMRYVATAVFAQEGLTLRQRVERIIEKGSDLLTDKETGVKIDTEYASAVGKDENEDGK